METSRSLASGTGGGPLGTERLSALPFFPRASAGAGGRLFADEVERAAVRQHGDAPQARRLDQLAGERRASRRAGFGLEHGDAPRAESSSRNEPELADVPAPASLAAARPQVPVDPPPFESTAESEPAPGSGPAAPRASAPETASTAVATGATATLPAAAAAPQSVPTNAPLAPRTPAAPPPSVEAGVPRGAAAAPGPRAPTPVRGAQEAALLERAEEILRQIRLHTSPGVKRISFDLEPVDLGRLSIQLTLRSGKVTAIVRGDSAETLELLQQREHDLMAVFAERGIQADSLRFEHGFGGARSGAGGEPRTAVPAPARGPSSQEHRPATARPTLHLPRDPARIDTYA